MNYALLEPLNSLLVPDHFDGVGLGLSAGYEVELGDAAEVLELQSGLSQNALHGTLGEGRVVVCNVLAESVQIKDFVNLSRSVCLGGIGLLGLLRARLARHDCNRIIDHSIRFLRLKF